MQPHVPQAVLPMPLQWNVATGTTPDGDRIAMLTLLQGNMQIQIQVGIRDMERPGKTIEEAVRQAMTGLIVPGSNGGGVHA